MTAADIRVLVVDDRPAARRRMRDMLGEADGVVCVGTAASAGEAHELWLASERAPADVVLVERGLPDEDGLALCLWLATRAPAPAVVMLSPDGPATALPARVAGAVGVVSPPSSVADLATTIRAAVAGTLEPPADDPRTAAVLGARLASDELPILGMLRHGVDPADIAATLGIDEKALVARRWAMLEVLTAPVPERRVLRERRRPVPVPALAGGFG